MEAIAGEFDARHDRPAMRLLRRANIPSIPSAVVVLDVAVGNGVPCPCSRYQIRAPPDSVSM